MRSSKRSSKFLARLFDGDIEFGQWSIAILLVCLMVFVLIRAEHSEPIVLRYLAIFVGPA